MPETREFAAAVRRARRLTAEAEELLRQAAATYATDRPAAVRLLTQGLRRSHEADDAIARVAEIVSREAAAPTRGLIFSVGPTGVEYVREATAAETAAAERV